jgi:hypothetical protein
VGIELDDFDGNVEDHALVLAWDHH